MLIGAVLAGADEEAQNVILQVAGDIGLAFQIQDDILDVTSDMETLGKPIGSDEEKPQDNLCDNPWTGTGTEGRGKKYHREHWTALPL